MATNKKQKRPKWPTIKPHHIGIAGVLALLVTGAAWLLVTLVLQPWLQGNAVDCTVTSKLVNPCRPWLGAVANNYPQTSSDIKSQLLYHETRIGRSLDLMHTYHAPGKNALTATDLWIINRTPTTYLYTTWKPAASWGDADGSNSTVDSGITQMANSIKAVKPHKIFLTLNHEPENEVSSGASGCTSTTYKGDKGTPAQYRAMWAHVRTRFADLGADNVVWAIDYMNYSPFDCMIDDLYPGDSLVDWIMFNAYGNGTGTFYNKVKHFTDILNSQGRTNKPWGIIEWAYHRGDRYSEYFDEAKASLDHGDFPIKLYSVFDARDQGSSTGLNSRVAYDDAGNYSATQMAHYKAFAQDPKFDNPAASQPPADTSPPKVSLTVPSNGSTQSGTIKVQGTASDNVAIKSIALRVDGTTKATDATSPVSFSLNTTNYSDGDHSIALRATDTSGNVGQSSTVTIHVKNHSSTPTSNPTTPTTVITPAQPSSPAAPTSVDGDVVVAPTNPGSSLDVYVDGQKIDGNVVDTEALTDGTHKVTIVEDGKSSDSYIQVDNPFWQSIINHFRSNIIIYASGLVVVIAIGVTIVLRKFVLNGAASAI